jgi:hypothetical protein
MSEHKWKFSLNERLSIKTPSITILHIMHSAKVYKGFNFVSQWSQRCYTYAVSCYAECGYYAGCRHGQCVLILLFAMLSVIILSFVKVIVGKPGVIMLSVNMMSDIMVSFNMPSVIMLCVIMIRVKMPSVIMMVGVNMISIIMLSVNMRNIMSSTLY